MDTTGKEGTCAVGSCKKGVAQETETKLKEQESPEAVVCAACPCKESGTQDAETKSNGQQSPAAVPVNNTAEAPVKSRPEKLRKKDDKSVEHVLKALNSLDTTEEKLAAMCKKYADIFDENRKLQLLVKQTEKRCSVVQREKEQLQTEHSKAILTRSRLENLCRELQRQNKAIKDESLLRIREEEEKRKEVSAKFQNTLSEITALMQQNNDKNNKLRDDNIDMSARLKNVCEQYELREQQVEKISKQMQLEAQLADAKLAKVKMEMAAEKEILLREKQQLLMDLTQYQARCQEFQATEVNLRNQISMYNDKYDEFQKALTRSNEVFSGFKTEMEKMSKKICKLEKETSSWKQRWELSHSALLEMAADKQKSEQELTVATRQLATLQNLCRTLQADRTTLLARLKQTMASPNSELSGESSTVSDTTQESGQSSVKETQQISGVTSSSNQGSSDASEQNSVQSSSPSQENKVSDLDTIESHSSPNVVEQSTVVENEKQTETSATDSTAPNGPDSTPVQCDSSVTSNSQLPELVNDTHSPTEQNKTDVNISVNASLTDCRIISGDTNNMQLSGASKISDTSIGISESIPLEVNTVNGEMIVDEKCQNKDNNSKHNELNSSVCNESAETTSAENDEVPSNCVTETSNSSSIISDKDVKTSKIKSAAEGKKGKESSRKKKK